MKKQFAVNYLMSQMWAVDQSLLSTMGDIASRQFSIKELDSALESTPEALEGKTGTKMTKTMERRENGVALIHVNGVISRYSSVFHSICGGTSTQMLARDFTLALNDPSIRGIVLNIDSPGGDANGIHELAEMIYQARGKKPIKSYVGGSGASAAYWIATAADEVVIDATAQLGSIGVVMSLRRRKDSDDIETLEIVSSQSPDKRLDPSSEKGRESYQARLDELADVFIDRVARNMAVDRDTVMRDFGRGGVLIGKSAVNKGMATRLGSLESVIGEMSKGNNLMSVKGKTRAESKVSDDEQGTFALPAAEEMSADELIAAIGAQRPDVIESLTPSPMSAISAAAEIAKACADAGVPALSASLLREGVTKADAESQLKIASELKDILSAAGLSGSFDSLVAHINEPVKLVGQAIHEAKAAGDEAGDGSRHIVDSGEKNTSVSARDIYAKRNSNGK